MKKYPFLLLLALLLSACELPNITGAASTALAQTQTAQAASNQTFVLSQQQTLQAISLTQTAQSAGILSQQQTQTALAQTQTALINQASASQLEQTSAALTLAVSPAPADPGPAQTQIALMQTQVALTEMAAAQSQPGSAGLAEFNGATIYSFSYYQKDQLLVTIQLTGNVQGSYYATVNGQTFKCSVQPAYPDRLYCTGDQKKGGFQIVQVFETGSAMLVFQGEFELPVWTPTKTPLPTPKHAYTPTPFHRKSTATPTP